MIYGLQFSHGRRSGIFTKWLKDCDTQTRARVVARIRRVQMGNFGDWKSVGGGVSELRIDHGPGYRVYLARKGSELVVLLAGGDKGSQDRDIKRAKEVLADYQGSEK